MFDKNELMYLLECVENSSISTTQMARNKAVMTMKLCDLIDEAAAAEEKPVAPKKKVAAKKK